MTNHIQIRAQYFRSGLLIFLWLAGVADNLFAATTYPAEVLNDSPLAYYRLTEPGPATPDVATNSGSLGAAGNGLHHVGVIHPVPGALAGSLDTAAAYVAIDSTSDDGGSPTTVNYTSALNPAGSFTIEAWLLPTVDGLGNAQCPMVNRFIASTGARFGWDFFQRSSGTGWNFRMFNGTAGSNTKMFDVTGGPYSVGSWCHLVAVYNATAHSVTLYLNGAQVAFSNTPIGPYAANTISPLSIGGFSDQVSGNGYENPFIGSIDEWAMYTNALSAAQVLNHYQNGTNPSRATPYESLIVADGPVEYLRLNEPAHTPATNSGSLGAAADGIYAGTAAAVAGPQPSANAGFEPTNPGQNFSGNVGYVELGNPPDLKITGEITLEAWIQPAAGQGFESYIIAHGGNNDFSGEVMLRIENGNYQIGSNGGNAGSPVPAGDLGGGAWIHLCGTYDGFNWNLYRNGVLLATATDFVGPYPVNNANWAIGARGRWSTFKDVLDRQFQGRIDEPAIYNHALAADRIRAHYFAGRYGTLNPAPVITQPPIPLTRYLGGTAVFTVVAEGDATLSYQWKRNGTAISGANGSSLTLMNVQLSDAAAYNVVVMNSIDTAESSSASLTVLAGYGSLVSADQPVAYYPLNETSGTVAGDYYSGAFKGAYKSNPSLGSQGPSAATGTAVTFNGSSQYVLLGNPAALNFAGQITLEAWIKPGSFGGDRNVFEHGYTFTPSSQELFLRIEGGLYQVGAWDGVNHLASFTIPAGDLNNWVHLVGTYDGTSWNLYRNAALVASHADSGAIQVNGDWGIGAGTHAGDQRFFQGGIDEAAIYNYALPLDRIRTHYAAGSAHPLTITAATNSITLTWLIGTLQQADSVAGPYTDVTNAVSGFQVSTSAAAMKFYRLKF